VSQKNENTDSISYRCIEDIEATPIDWLWRERIAKGKLTLVAGHPGLGKSQLTASMVAIVSHGKLWPDGALCNQGAVIILSAEDDVSDTIRPRLEAAGADLSKVFIIDSVKARSFNLKSDVPTLAKMLNDLRVKGISVSLLIIDPLSSYLGNIDSNNNPEVRALLTPLIELAAKYQIAIIGINHLNKSSNINALMRVSNSVAFVAAARAVYLVAQDDEDENKRLFLPIKNNIGNDKTGLSFQIESQALPNGIETSKVVWNNEIILKNANDILADQSPVDKDALTEAIDFLRDLLADSPKTVGKIQEESKNAGHSWATIRRAKKSLKIKAKKIGMKGGWVWELPTKMLKTSEDDQDSHANNMNSFGKKELLPQNLNNNNNDEVIQ
jgi:archaellum biogenesis ATPase FlaH